MRALICVLLVVFVLAACGTENPTREDSSVLVSDEATIIVGEGATVFVDEGVSIEKQPDKPVSVNQIAQNLIHKRHCRVGDTVTIEAVVSEGSTALTIGLIELETPNEDVEFRVDVEPLLHVLACANYYQDGEKYEFTLFIGSIRFYTDEERQQLKEQHRKWLLENRWEDDGKVPPIFRVDAILILTEKLEKEIRAAGCWIDQEE